MHPVIYESDQGMQNVNNKIGKEKRQICLINKEKSFIFEPEKPFFRFPGTPYSFPTDILTLNSPTIEHIQHIP